MSYINITPHPAVPQHNRRVSIRRTTKTPPIGGEQQPSVVLTCRVDFIDDKGDVVNLKGITSYEVELQALNSTPVAAINPVTGAPLDGFQQGDTMGEYDYLDHLTRNLIVSPQDLEHMTVLQKDTEAGGKRFDV